MHTPRKDSHPRALGPIVGAVAITLALAACPGKQDETGTDTDATSGDASTDSAGSTSGATVPTSGATGSGSTIGEGSGSATESGGTLPTTGTGGAEETTTGETGGGLDEQCMAGCETVVACGGSESVEVCVQDCAEEYSSSPECAAAGGALASCIAGLTCEQLAQLQDGEPSVCEQELAATDEACLTPDCAFVGQGGRGECSLGRQCEEGPVQTYECVDDTCTCISDGVAGASCPAMQFCMQDIDAQRLAAAQCCGFDW